MLAKGDRVIFCASRATGRLPVVNEIIRSLGLVPLVYEGISKKGRSSSLDKELRHDFYGARFRVLMLEPDVTGSFEDNWAIPELKHVPSDRLLIYTTEVMPDQEIKRLELPVNPVHVKNAADFESDFRSRLERILRSA